MLYSLSLPKASSSTARATMRRLLPILVPLLACAAPAAAQNVTVAFHDAPVREVAAAFARFAGVSVVLGPGVEATVTAELRNQPWRTALEGIAGAYGFHVHEVAPGLLRLDREGRTVEGEALAPLATRVFRLSYVPAADAARTLDGLRSERGTVAALEAASAVVVRDTPERIATMARILGHAP